MKLLGKFKSGWAISGVLWGLLGFYPVTAISSPVDIHRACVLDGPKAVAQMLDLVRLSGFQGSYAQFNFDRGASEFSAEEVRLRLGQPLKLSKREIARQKARFIYFHVRNQVMEKSHGYFTKHEPTPEGEFPKSIEKFSQEDLESTSFEPIGVFYLNYYLMKRLGRGGFDFIANRSLEYEARKMELSPEPGVMWSIPSPLRSRVCVLAMNVFKESLELTPLSIARNLEELEMIVEEVEKLNPLFSQVRQLVEPKVEERWNVIPEFALQSFRQKFEWLQFLRRTFKERTFPGFVQTQGDQQVFLELLKEEMTTLEITLGYGDANIGNQVIADFAMRISTDQVPLNEDPKIMGIWHARMERELRRRIFAGHKLIEKDLWSPFVEKALKDFPQILPCNMREDCVDGAPPPSKFLRKERGMRILYESEFYEKVFDALMDLEHPYVLPVLVRIIELDLKHLPDWVLHLLEGDVSQPIAFPEMSSVQEDKRKKINRFFFPQRKGIEVLSSNMRFFSNGHLDILKEWSVEQMFKLQNQCEELGEICSSDRWLGGLVKEFLSHYGVLYSTASGVRQLRHEHESSFYKEGFAQDLINLESLYPLPDLEKELVRDPQTWAEEEALSRAEAEGNMEALNLPNFPNRIVSNVDYHLDRLETDLALRDLVYTPFRFLWHLEDHPGQIPIFAGVAIVFGGAAIVGKILLNPLVFKILLSGVEGIFVGFFAWHIGSPLVHLAHARSPGNRDNPEKYRGLRAARSWIAISNQVMWVAPILPGIAKRAYDTLKSVREGYRRVRDLRKAIEVLGLTKERPSRLTLKHLREAHRELVRKYSPDKFVRNPALGIRAHLRMEEGFRALRFLEELFTGQEGILSKIKIPTTEPGVMRAYEVLRMSPGTPISKVVNRLALRKLRVQALRRAGEKMEGHSLGKNYVSKADELERLIATQERELSVLKKAASALEDAQLTTNRLEKAFLDGMIQHMDSPTTTILEPLPEVNQVLLPKPQGL